jgi:hypothetical protein
MIVKLATAVEACGVVMKRLVRLLVLSAAMGAIALPAVAFQETTVGGGQPGPAAVQPAPAAESPKKAVEPGKGVNLTIPEVSIGKGSGTEVRIPGLGTVGVLPKLDFGLELLYGANETKGMPEERTEPNDLQIRGTIKHRF